MALYTKNTLVTMIRDEINEPVARIFSDTQLDNFLDQGAMAVSSLSLCEKDLKSIALATNQIKEDLANTMICVESVTYHLTASTEIEYGVQRVHPAVFGSVIDATAGPPKIWTYFANAVYIWPRPAGATYTIKVRGYSVVTGYDDGADANETLDNGLQFVPYYYALSMVYARLGKHRLSAIHMQQFIGECNQWRYDHEGAIQRVDSYNIGKIPDTTVIPQ